MRRPSLQTFHQRRPITEPVLLTIAQRHAAKTVSQQSPGADSWTETSRPSTLSTAATRPLGRGGQGPRSPGTTNWLPNHVRRLGSSARLRREGLIRKSLGKTAPRCVCVEFSRLSGAATTHTHVDVCLLGGGHSTRGRCLGSTFILAGPHIFCVLCVGLLESAGVGRNKEQGVPVT